MKLNTMTDPDDKTLLEFVARFVGWTELGHPLNKPEMLWGFSPRHNREFRRGVIDYLGSLDLWHRDVWPKIKAVAGLDFRWSEKMGACEPMACVREIANADAKSRCLALYRALDGTLPESQPKVDPC